MGSLEVAPEPRLRAPAQDDANIQNNSDISNHPGSNVKVDTNIKADLSFNASVGNPSSSLRSRARPGLGDPASLRLRAWP
eukprot:14981989-Alexandrium_andersonii.AAC.1